MTAREVSLQVVRDVFPAPAAAHTPRSAQEALDYRLRRSELQTRDRALATHLAFGSVKMRRTLEWYLAPYIRGRSKALPPVIGEILRLGIYELRFTATAPHAAVSQWVGLAKRYGHRGTAGLVNAVLRSFLRDDPAPPKRIDFDDEDEYLGTAFSFPTWLVRQWRMVFGSQLEAILEACNAPAQAAVTVNRSVTDREAVVGWFTNRGAQAVASDLAEDSVLVSDAALARAGEREANGQWWVQSESSGAVVDVVNPQPGEMLADVCSGRGSKALQAAARLQGEGSVVCIELDPRRAATLQQRAQEANLPLEVVVGDATSPCLAERFDRVLVDAPCSATGIVGRHPEARWRKQPDDGERLARTQRALLEALLSNVFEGGALVYAVCSTDPRETTDVINGFIRTHNVQRGLLPARFSIFETEDGDVLIPPGLSGRDGFFISRLERRI